MIGLFVVYPVNYISSVIRCNALLLVAVTLSEIKQRANEKLDWVSRRLNLAHGILSHDTFGCLFGLINPNEFEAAFRLTRRISIEYP